MDRAKSVASGVVAVSAGSPSALGAEWEPLPEEEVEPIEGIKISSEGIEIKKRKKSKD